MGMSLSKSIKERWRRESKQEGQVSEWPGAQVGTRIAGACVEMNGSSNDMVSLLVNMRRSKQSGSRTRCGYLYSGRAVTETDAWGWWEVIWAGHSENLVCWPGEDIITLAWCYLGGYVKERQRNRQASRSSCSESSSGVPRRVGAWWERGCASQCWRGVWGVGRVRAWLSLV